MRRTDFEKYAAKFRYAEANSNIFFNPVQVPGATFQITDIQPSNMFQKLRNCVTRSALGSKIRNTFFQRVRAGGWNGSSKACRRTGTGPRASD